MQAWPSVLFASLALFEAGLAVASHRQGARPVDEWLFKHRDHLPIPFLMIGILSCLVSRMTPQVSRKWMSLFGVFLVILGEGLRVWSVGIVGAATRSRSTNAQRLVQEGPYALTRNPIYAGNLLLCLGLTSFLHSWAALLACLLYFIIVYLRIIRAEEHFLQKAFGATYDDYCRRVRPILPRWNASEEALRAPFRLKELRKEYWTIAGIACALIAAEILSRRFH